MSSQTNKRSKQRVIGLKDSLHVCLFIEFQYIFWHTNKEPYLLVFGARYLWMLGKCFKTKLLSRPDNSFGVKFSSVKEKQNAYCPLDWEKKREAQCWERSSLTPMEVPSAQASNRLNSCSVWLLNCSVLLSKCKYSAHKKLKSDEKLVKLSTCSSLKKSKCLEGTKA